MHNRPLVLLTNDDGVAAVGLRSMREALLPSADVIVSAPKEQQSAVGHGITLGQPLRAFELEPDIYAVAGRPADSVFLGLSEFCNRTPDLVVSGINHGPNLGVDVLYSGTVAAATEGAMRGIPALAVSQMLPPERRQENGRSFSPWHAGDQVPAALERCLERTAAFAARVVAAMIESPPPDGVTINLNAPVAPTGAYRWTTLARQAYIPRPVRRLDPRGLPYFWVSAERSEVPPPEDSDIAAVLSHTFSLTALSLTRGNAWQDEGSWNLQSTP